MIVVVNGVFLGGNGFVDSNSFETSFWNNAYGSSEDTLYNNYYIVDQGNNAIRLVDLSSYSVTTLSGGNSTAFGSSIGYKDGIGYNALFNNPTNIIVTKNVNIETKVFVADTGNNVIRQITCVTG